MRLPPVLRLAVIALVISAGCAASRVAQPAPPPLPDSEDLAKRQARHEARAEPQHDTDLCAEEWVARRQQRYDETMRRYGLTEDDARRCAGDLVLGLANMHAPRYLDALGLTPAQEQHIRKMFKGDDLRTPKDEGARPWAKTEALLAQGRISPDSITDAYEFFLVFAAPFFTPPMPEDAACRQRQGN